MARDIYKNNLKQLKELKQARYVEPLAQEVRRMAIQINQRFYRLEKQGLAKDTAYDLAKLDTGKDKPRYTTSIDKLNKMSLQELYELGTEINAKLVSRTSTKTGQEEIADRRISMAAEKLEERGITISDKDDFKSFLEKGGGEFLNHMKKYVDSDQLVEDWQAFTQEGNVTEKEFMYGYRRYKNKENIDIEKIHRSYNKISKKRTARRKRR